MTQHYRSRVEEILKERKKESNQLKKPTDPVAEKDKRLGDIDWVTGAIDTPEEAKKINKREKEEDEDIKPSMKP